MKPRRRLPGLCRFLAGSVAAVLLAALLAPVGAGDGDSALRQCPSPQCARPALSGA